MHLLAMPRSPTWTVNFPCPRTPLLGCDAAAHSLRRCPPLLADEAQHGGGPWRRQRGRQHPYQVRGINCSLFLQAAGIGLACSMGCGSRALCLPTATCSRDMGAVASICSAAPTRAAHHTTDALLRRAVSPCRSQPAAQPSSPALPTHRLPCRTRPLPRSYGTFLKRLQDPVIAEVERRVASECEQMRAGSTACLPACTRRQLQGGQAWGGAPPCCAAGLLSPRTDSSQDCATLMPHLHPHPLVLHLVAMQLGRS